MNLLSEGPSDTPAEAFLSGAYRRIRRITIVLSLIAIVVATLFSGWRNGLGVLAGAALGYANLIWLHHASTMMVERMMPAAVNAPSRLRVLLGFAGRYAFVVIAAYVILRSWSEVLVGFIVGLFLPIAAAMCEGIYEAFAGGKNDSPAN